MRLSSTNRSADYLYDGMDLIEEVDSSGNVLARYTHSPGIDDPLNQLRSGTTSYYHQDGLGSITSLSNGAGALANTYTYDSFGKLIASTGTLTNPFQYTGRELDQETGMYYYRARHYDQSIGRFLSEDPLRSSVKTNPYKYVSNNPLLLADPLGLTETCTFAGVHQLTPWITYKTERTPISGWTLTWSGETGGPRAPGRRECSPHGSPIALQLPRDGRRGDWPAALRQDSHADASADPSVSHS